MLSVFRESAAIGYETRREARTQASERNAAIRHADTAKADSAIALSRVQSTCIPVFYRVDGEPAYLTENSEVKAGDGMDKDLGDGSIICTATGDTAEVWGGKAYQVKRVAIDDRKDYMSRYAEITKENQ